MGEPTSYKPGTFCWTDSAPPTRRPPRRSTRGCFGWDCEDSAGRSGRRLLDDARRRPRRGGDLAQPGMMRDAGAPPTWNSYVSVDDVDAAAARARTRCDVMAEPFDVLEAGRMAVVHDPRAPSSCPGSRATRSARARERARRADARPARHERSRGGGPVLHGPARMDGAEDGRAGRCPTGACSTTAR